MAFCACPDPWRCVGLLCVALCVLVVGFVCWWVLALTFDGTGRWRGWRVSPAPTVGAVSVFCVWLLGGCLCVLIVGRVVGGASAFGEPGWRRGWRSMRLPRPWALGFAFCVWLQECD